MHFNPIKAVSTTLFVILSFAVGHAHSSAGPKNSEKISVEYGVRVDSTELASRDDVTVTFAELDAFLATIPEDRRAAFLSDPERFTQALVNLLDIKHMAQAAVDADLDRDAVVQARLANAVWRELAEIFREQYPAEHLREDYTARAEELYLSEPDRFSRADRVSFSHVLLSFEEHPDEQARKAKAGDLLDELEAGADIFELAREYSNDPSVAVNDGTLENVALDRLDPQFGEPVADMAVGETAIVESGFGTHVVKLIDRKDAGRASFDEVADQLVKRARQQHRTRILEQHQKEFYEHELTMPDSAARSFLEQYGVSWE